MQSRWKSKTAWISLFALIIFIMKTYFGYELPEADVLVQLLLATMAGLGIFNNPTDPEKY